MSVQHYTDLNFDQTLLPSDGSANIFGCLFIALYSYFNGGAICMYSSYSFSLSVSKCIFIDCNSNRVGGAIYSNSFYNNISDSCFQNCHAPSSSVVRILGYNNYFYVNRSFIYGHISSTDSGIIFSGETNIENLNFTHTKATYLISFSDIKKYQFKTNYSIFNEIVSSNCKFGYLESCLFANMTFSYLNAYSMNKCSFMNVGARSENFQFIIDITSEYDRNFCDKQNLINISSVIVTENVPNPIKGITLCPIIEYQKIEGETINTKFNTVFQKDLYINKCIFNQTVGTPIQIHQIPILSDECKFEISECQFYKNVGIPFSGCIMILMRSNINRFNCSLSKLCAIGNFASFTTSYHIIVPMHFNFNQSSILYNPEKQIFDCNYIANFKNGHVNGINVSCCYTRVSTIMAQNTFLSYCHFQNNSIFQKSGFVTVYNYDYSNLTKCNFLDLYILYFNNGVQIKLHPHHNTVIFTDCVFRGDFLPLNNESSLINCVFLSNSDQNFIVLTKYMINKCQKPNFRRLTKNTILLIALSSVIAAFLISLAVFWRILRRYSKNQSKLMKKFDLEKSIMNDFG